MHKEETRVKKRWTSAFLAALMAASACLSGCGSAGSGAQASASGSQADGSSELEPVTIQMWLGGPGKQKDSDMVWEAFNEKL